MKKLAIVAVLAAIVAGGSVLYGKLVAPSTPSGFRTAPVKKDDLLITVGASGILQPEEVVDIGAQVVGRIKELGLDPRAATDPKFAGKTLDYTSPVTEGMVLAQIDPAIYNAQLLQQKALVDRSKADLLQLEAKCMQADAEWKRAQRLHELKLNPTTLTGLKPNQSTALPIKGISDADYILAEANYKMALASCEVGKATIDQQKAAMTLAQTNVDYTTIKSPVSGTIIDRRVNIGQTVVSSMNAPSLFLIAKDLRRMQVWASVNEADIGRVRMDMPVRFTVDELPDDVFHGHVSQIRLNATMTQNVVTYTVVISAANDDLKLLPYLTSDVKFEIENRPGVLMVPNAALRFKPKANHPVVAEAAASVEPAADTKKDRGKGGKGKKRSTTDNKTGTVWVFEEELLHPIQVQLGLSDGIMTEVSGEGLSEDLEVVLGEQRVETVATEVNNPLGPPKFPRGGGKGGPGGGGGGGRRGG